MAVSINGEALKAGGEAVSQYITGRYVAERTERKYGENVQKNTAQNGRADSLSFQDRLNQAANKPVRESAVASYKRRHPEHASAVDSFVNSGKFYLTKIGADGVSREDMTMEEYKGFITDIMNGIPFDSSQYGDVEIWSVTEKGWEQMKNDPDYEAWVIGYTVRDRAFHNPFAAMPGYSPNIHTEHFGASIEEHLGQSVPVKQNTGKSERADDGKSWWDLRMERFAEYMEEQEAFALAKRQAAGIHAMELHKQALLERRWGDEGDTEAYSGQDIMSVQELMAQLLVPMPTMKL